MARCAVDCKTDAVCMDWLAGKGSVEAVVRSDFEVSVAISGSYFLAEVSAYTLSLCSYAVLKLLKVALVAALVCEGSECVSAKRSFACESNDSL